MRKLAFGLVLVIALLAVVACDASSASSAAAATSSVAAITAPAVCMNTVRVGVLQDKSESATPNGVYQLRAADLRLLRDLLIQCGGELAVGLVGTASGAPLQRWSVPSPTTPPPAPKGEETAINAAIMNSAYRTELAVWQSGEERRVGEAGREFEAFIAQVTPLLSAKADDRVTPLWLALARVDAFLGEPDSSSLPSHRYSVLSSDGINTEGDPIPLTSGASLFISNGSQAVGSLDKLPATIVESPIGAFRKIRDQEEAGHDGHN